MGSRLIFVALVFPLASTDQSKVASISTTSGTLNLGQLQQSNSSNLACITIINNGYVLYSDAKPSLAKLSLLPAAQGKKIKIIEKVAPFWQSIGDQLDFDEI